MFPRSLSIVAGVILLGWLTGCAQQQAAAPRGAAGATAAGAKAPAQGAGPQSLTRVVTADGLELTSVFFDFDRSDIKPEYRAALAQEAAKLAQGKGLIVIEGHCDERGSPEYNLALGQRRALAVRNALGDGGVPRQRMKVISYGAERPLDAGHAESAWAKNRRGTMALQ
jgi:peptidoglycan-associated lipoprotein